jgi:hypothetical protein
MDTTHEPMHLLDKVWHSKISWTCLQALVESPNCLMNLLIMAIVRNFEVVLGQTLNHAI